MNGFFPNTSHTNQGFLLEPPFLSLLDHVNLLKLNQRIKKVIYHCCLCVGLMVAHGVRPVICYPLLFALILLLFLSNFWDKHKRNQVTPSFLWHNCLLMIHLKNAICEEKYYVKHLSINQLHI